MGPAARIRSLFKKEKAYVTHWFNLDEKIRFALIGAVNMGLRYILFILLGLIFTSMHYQLTLALMWFLSSFIAFFMYKKLVFRTRGNHLKEYGKSVVTWGVSYVINALLLELMIRRFSLPVIPAQGIAIVVIVVVNYLMFKHFAFKKKLTRWERFLQLFDNFTE